MTAKRTLHEKSLMTRIGQIGRALLPAAVLALALPGAASAADWTGIWTTDPAWCKYKDQIGGHDPAPVRFTATEITGLENTCKINSIEKLGELSAWRLSLTCTGEGMTNDQETILMLAGDGALWQFDDYEPLRFTRCKQGKSGR